MTRVPIRSGQVMVAQAGGRCMLAVYSTAVRVYMVMYFTGDLVLCTNARALPHAGDVAFCRLRLPR